jgi:spermidine/putrescine-binding protein
VENEERYGREGRRMKKTYYNSRKSLVKKKERMDIEGRLDWMVPRIYASLGLILYDKYQWEPEQIQELFSASQSLWNDSVREGWDMLKNAEEIVGVSFERFVESGNIV